MKVNSPPPLTAHCIAPHCTASHRMVTSTCIAPTPPHSYLIPPPCTVSILLYFIAIIQTPRQPSLSSTTAPLETVPALSTIAPTPAPLRPPLPAVPPLCQPIQLERLLASHAFALPVSRAEARGSGVDDKEGSSFSGSRQDQVVVSARGARSAIGYTRSGEVLGEGRGVRVSGVSAQVQKRADRGGGVRVLRSGRYYCNNLV